MRRAAAGNEMTYAIVMTTCEGPENAKLIAKNLIERRLAACVQLLPIESYFTWEGELQNAQELLLLCKTKSGAFQDVEALIRKLHTYTTPEIVQVPIERGSKAYLDWISSMTR
ncbi:MAG TPA: divalent-cation tolerance protein CutA [Beijerinckia sp.]|jgi:periplasmic divalent cation tolerance protein|nr:divalent-cation tolerance protein CutA [Beijerinckia sp.]